MKSLPLKLTPAKNVHPDIIPIQKELELLQKEGKILLAYLFGPYSRGEQTESSDIDIAVYINAESESEMLNIEDRILVSSNLDIELLRLDNEDENPNIVMTAMNDGIPLITVDSSVYYDVARRALHESEDIRGMRERNSYI